MLRTDGWIVEPRRDRVRQRDLPRVILQYIRERALQHARNTAAVFRKTRCMLTKLVAATACFHADEAHTLVVQKFVKRTHGVRAATDAGDDRIGQATLFLEDLPARLFADDAMEVADHGRIRMRAQYAAQKVMRGADIGDPVAHRFVDGIFQGTRAGGHALHVGAEQAHAVDVQLLPPHVLFAHVNDAIHAEEGADGSRGDTVLACSRLGDDALLAHAAGQQALPESIVDLVCAGVQQVFALEVDLRAAEFFGQA